MLNRPDVRNAFNDGVIAELTWWADSVSSDGTCGSSSSPARVRRFARAPIWSGWGGWPASAHQQNLDDASDMARMFLTLDRLPTPVIGRVQGAALGGGTGLAAICDIVVAADDAVFGLTEVRLGLIPAVIAPFVIAQDRTLGGARAVSDRATVQRRAREDIGVGAHRRAGDGLDQAVAGYVKEPACRRTRARSARRSSSSPNAPRSVPRRRRCAPKPSPCGAPRQRDRKGSGRSWRSESQLVTHRHKHDDTRHRRYATADRSMFEGPDRQSRRDRDAHDADVPRDGHRTVAVYSDADERSRSRGRSRRGDSARSCGAFRSYLSSDLIIDAARSTAPTPFTPATAFCRRTARLPPLARMPAWYSSAHRRRR